jgi:hypothetical protein
MIADSNVTSYNFDPCADDGTPSMHTIPFTEIKEINSKSEAFKNGFLRFEKDAEEEIYEALGIRNYKDILSQEDIKEIILNPTREGLQKFLDIKTPGYFDRVMGVFTAIIQSKAFDISMRVKELIERRYAEIRAGLYQTKIVLTALHNEKAQSREVDELKRQLDEAYKKLQGYEQPVKQTVVQVEKEEKTVKQKVSVPKRNKKK